MQRRIPLLAAGLLLSGCRSHAPLRLGIVLDQDGERGAALAAADVNAAGGIRHRLLELRALRGSAVSTAARMALAGANSLVSDPSILAVVGHTNSNASLAAAQVYNEHHTVQIAPTTTTPLYSDAGKYSFRLVASDVHQAAFLANVLLSKPGQRIAVLYVNDDYGRALDASVADHLAANGVTAAYESPFGEGGAFTDADDLARAVARSHPTVLLWLGRSRELAVLMPILHSLVPKLDVLASDGFAGVASESGRVGALVGVKYVRLLDLENPTDGIRALRQRYEREWHELPTDQGILAYEAVQVLARAIAEAGADREAIRTYLSQLGTTRPPIQALAGPVTFDAKGDPPPRYYLAEVTATGPRPVPVPSTGGINR